MESCINHLGLDSEGAKKYIEVRRGGRRSPDRHRQLCKECKHNPAEVDEAYCQICIDDFRKANAEETISGDIDMEGLATLQRLAREANERDPI